MGSVDVLPPGEYAGQLLCPACGVDESGNYYATCANEGYTHEEACMIGKQYSRDLCVACDERGDRGYVVVRAIERVQDELARGIRASVTIDPDEFGQLDEMDRDAVVAFFEQQEDD